MKELYIEKILTSDADFIEEVQKIDNSSPQRMNIDFVIFEKPIMVKKITINSNNIHIIYTFYDINNNKICKIQKFG